MNKHEHLWTKGDRVRIQFRPERLADIEAGRINPFDPIYGHENQLATVRDIANHHHTNDLPRLLYVEFDDGKSGWLWETECIHPGTNDNGKKVAPLQDLLKPQKPTINIPEPPEFDN